MEAGKSNKRRKKKSEPNVGFQFNAPVTANSQTFINGDVGIIKQGLSSEDLGKLDEIFRPFQDKVQQEVPPEKQTQVEQTVQDLHTELSKGENTNAERLNKIIDSLVEMVPGAVGAVTSMFASPILGALVGPATKLVLDHIKK